MKWMITCKEATQFISQKEEGKISMLQQLQLWLHIGICGLCKLFYKQNKVLIKSLPHLQEYTDTVLTSAEKEIMISRIEATK